MPNYDGLPTMRRSIGKIIGVLFLLLFCCCCCFWCCRFCCLFIYLFCSSAPTNLPIPTELLGTADYAIPTYVCNCLFCFVLFIVCFVLRLLTFSCERIFMLLPTCQCLPNVMEE